MAFGAAGQRMEKHLRLERQKNVCFNAGDGISSSYHIPPTSSVTGYMVSSMAIATGTRFIVWGVGGRVRVRLFEITKDLLHGTAGRWYDGRGWYDCFEWETVGISME